jgi:hypothetical protein
VPARRGLGGGVHRQGGQPLGGAGLPGQDEAAQIVYGVGEDAAQSAVAPLRAEVRRYSVRKLARTAGIDARSVTRFRSGLVTPRPVTLGRLKQGLERLRDLGLADRDQSEASEYSR